MMKKKYLSGIFCLIAIVMIGGMVLSCGSKNKTDPKPTYTGVVIKQNGDDKTGLEVNGVQGTSLTFTAEVTGKNKPKKDVTWSLTGNGTGTTLVNGVLTIAASETVGAILKVTATSVGDTTKSAYVDVKVIGSNDPRIDSLTIDADSDDVALGGTVQFTFTIVAVNGASEDVTWSITSTVESDDTEIDADGLLTVGADETATSITVKATPVEEGFENLAASKTITVIGKKVISVTVTADEDDVAWGGTLQFNADVEVENGASTDVTWEITSTFTSNDTEIDADGLLTVGADETVYSITVTATPVEPGFEALAESKTVLVYDPNAPRVVSLSIEADKTSVFPGGTVQFDYDIDVENSANTDVTWEITSTFTSIDTEIDPDTGLLTVGTDETATEITVTATPVEAGFESKAASMTIFVLGQYDMYIDGPRDGLSVTNFTDFPWYSHSGADANNFGTIWTGWGSHITLESVGDGINGGNAIKAERHPNSATEVNTGFALMFNNVIDMSDVVALSIKVKASDKENVEVRMVGFGDAGTYANWNGTHKGVLYKGENNNDIIPITTDEWQQIIVPVPYGATAPDLSRVLTFVAEIPYGEYILIDEIRFLTEGVTCVGLKVPGEKADLDLETDIDVATLFSTNEIAWTFVLDSDSNKTPYSVYFRTDAWVHLNGWSLPAGYDSFELSSLTSTNPGDIVEGLTANTITSDVSLAEGTLVLKNGQGLESNIIDISFGEEGVLVIHNLGAISSGLWGVQAVQYGQTKDDRLCASGQMSGGGWYQGFGANPFNPAKDLTGYTQIQFSIYFDSAEGTVIGTVLRFGLDLYINGLPDESHTEYLYDITTTAGMDKTWTLITIDIADLRTAVGDNLTGTAPTSTLLSRLKAWRLVGGPFPGEFKTGGLVYIDKIVALE